MKKIFILAAVAATLVMASCSKEAENKVFKAEAEAAAESGKVTYSGGSLLWQAGDEVSIYDGSSNSAVYAVASGDGTSRCEFAYSSGSALDAGSYTAVSPAAIRTGVSTISLPATQSSADGSLTGLPMYAVSSSENLKFYNLCGVVRFRLTASSAARVRSIAVTTNANTNGAATISGSGTSVALSTPSGTSTTTLSIGTPQSIASAHDFYMYLPAGSYSTFNITVTASNSTICTKTASSAVVVERGKITTITLSGLSFGASLPTGAIDGLFTVNASGDKVYFSQGNLQYQASTGTWRFATNQYDCIGSSNSSISSTYSGWIDLFGWGTSGWNNGNVYYQPYSTANTGSSSNGYGYGPTDGSSYTYNLTGSYANADWGVNNAISNGGNAAGLWRTLTHEEWAYLFNTRTDASSKWGNAKVANVNGVIVLPDSFTDPMLNNGSGAFSSSHSSWEDNVYSDANWTAMQAAGAVFLPAAGYRDGASVNYVGSYSFYWSSSYNSSFSAWGVNFRSDNLSTEGNYYRNYGLSVRLVRG